MKHIWKMFKIWGKDANVQRDCDFIDMKNVLKFKTWVSNKHTHF